MDWLQKLLSGEASAPRINESGGKKDFGFLSNADELLEELENGSEDEDPDEK